MFYKILSWEEATTPNATSANQNKPKKFPPTKKIED